MKLYHRFPKLKTTTLILTCRSKLFSYHLLNIFMVLYNESYALDNVPLKLKQQIYAIDKHQTNY